jgi:hypothetical protein
VSLARAPGPAPGALASQRRLIPWYKISMPTPFPGMDPYLEHPARWTNLHARLTVGLANALGERLPPGYVVNIQERVYVGTLDLPPVPKTITPDVALCAPLAEGTQPWTATATEPVVVHVPVTYEARDAYLEIRDARSGEEVVTVIELLSPAKKQPGNGWEPYLAKRRQVLDSRSNLVEIDLLRGGDRMPIVERVPRYDYGFLVSRHATRPQATLISFSVREPIPVLVVPLRPDEGEVPLDLRPVLDEIYDRAGMALRIDYSRPPEPPLSPEDAAWADAILHDHGLRK